MASIVSFNSRRPSAEDDTTVVNEGEVPFPAVAAHTRVQVRLPMRSTEEIEMHLSLLQAAITHAQEALRRGRRNHRKAEAVMLARHHLQEANRLINARANLTKP